jgi:hypothetical protein
LQGEDSPCTWGNKMPGEAVLSVFVSHQFWSADSYVMHSVWWVSGHIHPGWKEWRGAYSIVCSDRSVLSDRSTRVIPMFSPLQEGSGGRLEYHCHSPSRCRRWQRGNRVPASITGPPCHWGDVTTGTWSSRLGVGYKVDILVFWKNYLKIQRSENKKQSYCLY